MAQVLADSGGDGAAELLDGLLRCRARHAGQASGEQKALSGQRSRAGLLLLFHIQPGLFESFDELAVRLLLEPLIDAPPAGWADAGDCHDLLLAGRHELIYMPEMLRDQLRALLAHIANVECEEQARERALLTRLDGLEHIIRALLLDALQRQQLLAGQRVEIREGLDQASLNQLFTHTLADALNIHCAFRDEVPQTLQVACGTGQIGTVGHRHICFALDGSPADRAIVGQMVDLLVAGAALDHRFDDLGNHLAGALDQHPVADAQVFALDIALVVQGGPLDGYAANVDRFEQGPGIDRAGAPDIDANVEQTCCDLRGGILKSNRPAWIAGDGAQFLLLHDIINLDDHAIDLVGQVEAIAFPLLAVLHDLIQIVGELDIGIDREAPFADQFQALPLAMHLHALDIADLIAKEVQLAAGGDARILLAQRASGGVARIGEKPAVADLLVQLLEAFDRHIDLAAYLHALGNALAAQLLGNAADRAHVRRPVLANHAIPTRGPDDQAAFLIGQSHRQAIDFKLADIRKRGVGQNIQRALVPV